MEWTDRFCGVDFINDSKATNVDSVLKAIEGLDLTDNIVLIMGGKYKGGDFSLLKDAVKNKVKHIVLIGEAAELISKQLKGVVNMKRAANMKEAVDISFNLAKLSGIVLLSPGCASFDMFESFIHRGRVFKDEVKIYGKNIKKT